MVPIDCEARSNDRVNLNEKATQTCIRSASEREHRQADESTYLAPRYVLDACSGGPIAVPDIGSIQTRWSRTPLTPGTFSAASKSARRFLSSRIVPQNSTVPLRTMMSIKPTGAQLSRFNSVNRASRIDS